MLTVTKLDNMEPGELFATGLTIDNPSGVNMQNTDNVLRWVAVRGKIHDWAIYAHLDFMSEEEVAAIGDKVTDKENIKRLVPCEDEAMNLYRF